MAAKSSKTARRADPYYEQVANILRTGIVSADDPQPVRLSSERDLCEVHRVSRITIRKALDLLEHEGLVQRTRGRGTLTVPEAIRQWKRLRHDRVIHVMANWEGMVNVPGSYYGQIYQGLCSGAERAGYRLTIHTLSGRAQIDSNVTIPEAARTLGVIFVGLMNDAMVRLYTQAGYPLVCVDYWTTDPRADSVVVDCYGEGQVVAEFLGRQGHRDLFFIGNMLRRGTGMEKETDAELFLAGLQRGLALHGLPAIPPDRICYINEQVQGLGEAARWFLSLRPRPTAGFIFSATLLQRFLSHLRPRGIRCPEDVSLVGKTWSEDPIEATCLRIDARMLGTLALDCLLDRASLRRSTAVRVAVASRLDRGRTVRQLPIQ